MVRSTLHADWKCRQSEVPAFFGETIQFPGQQGEAYDYGDLQAKRGAGKHYKDFNREQQAQMVEDYYLWLHPSLIYNPATGAGDPTPKATKADLEPFIAEMRAGEF